MNRFSIAAIFIVGIGIGIILYLNSIAISMLSKVIELLLYILITIVAITIAYEIKSFKEVIADIHLSLKLIVATILGSVVGGVIVAVVLHGDIIAYLAITLGMGWYTFTGSYLATIDSYLGLLGFTVNMFREITLIILYPILSRKYPIEAISIGGATTMDTTLPIIIRYTNTRISTIAFIHGLVLTLLIPIIIPLLL